MIRWIERSLNVVIVAAGITILGSAALRGLSWLDRPTDLPSARKSEARTAKPTQYVPGDRLPALEGVEYSRAAKTIVLFVGTHCQYCINNMDFYRLLAEEAARTSGALQLVVAGPEPVPTLNAFLRQYALDVDGVVSVSAGQVRVLGTPTLVLADRNGVVKRVWVGQQGPTGRAQILALAGNAGPTRDPS